MSRCFHYPNHKTHHRFGLSTAYVARIGHLYKAKWNCLNVIYTGCGREVGDYKDYNSDTLFT